MGCPWTAHCWVSGLFKSVPGLCEMGLKCPCVLVCIGPENGRELWVHKVNR